MLVHTVTDCQRHRAADRPDHEVNAVALDECIDLGQRKRGLGFVVLLEYPHLPSAGALGELLEIESEAFGRVCALRGVHARGRQQQADFYVTEAHGAAFTARYSPLPTGTRQAVN